MLYRRLVILHVPNIEEKLNEVECSLALSSPPVYLGHHPREQDVTPQRLALSFRVFTPGALSDLCWAVVDIFVALLFLLIKPTRNILAVYIWIRTPLQNYTDPLRIDNRGPMYADPPPWPTN